MSETNYFFCGVGGSGMSALAVLLLEKGYKVSGSDRAYDKGDAQDKFKALEKAGVKLFSQDGSGITNDVDVLVVSSAVENTIPDVAAAINLKIKIKKRAEILADLVNAARGICVGGTSGKTTVTGMIAHMLFETGHNPSFMNGGQGVNFLDKKLPGNACLGKGDLFVTETDESDGSIAFFEPDIAVLNNISFDHKPLDELRPMFHDFIAKARTAAIINIDDVEAEKLSHVHANTITFSLNNPDANIMSSAYSMNLQVPGEHNLYNALASLAVAKALGIDERAAVKALESFKGIKRRFEVVGSYKGITVIDDFGHNPDKIEATLKTLKQEKGRIISIFQPHGFGPTKMLKEGLIKVFSEYLSEQDFLVMPEIYYAGGSADKSISSKDITDALEEKGKRAFFFEHRNEIPAFIASQALSGDQIVVMGARDDTLSEFAQAIFSSLKQKAA